MDIDDGILTSSATAQSLSALSSFSPASALAAAASKNAAALAALSELSEVGVRFFTRQAELPQVPHTFLNVPVSLARYGLSEIVNALTNADPPRPFDFLINGSFLRSSLLKYLQRLGSGGEGGLEIEYVEALPEPESQQSRPHPDWVASIDACSGQGGKHIVTGCYDSVVRVYDATKPQGKPIALGVGHASAVKAVAAFQPMHSGAGAGASASSSASPLQIVSGSKDRSVRVWTLQGGALRCTAQCAGHTDSVEAVATVRGSTRFASGGWDQTVRLWDVTNAESAVATEEAQANKKRKTTTGAAAVNIPSFAPLATLSGHIGAVTGLVYPHPAALYSASMDHSLRQWDVETGASVHAWFAPRCATAIDFSTEANLLGSAHTDSHVRVYDPRKGSAAASSSGGNKEAIKLTLKSHKGWVSALAFNPRNAHQLATVAYDHTVKLWDLRAALPLFTMRPHTDKLFAVDWSDEDTIVSGGADKQLQTHTISKQKTEAE